MKKRLIRHYFNMVEIALALAVLAIGMSSILVLFPVGINANKSAIADNNLADIGEYLMGYLRAGCAAEWAKIAKDKKEAEEAAEAGGDPVSAPSENEFFFSNKIATSYNQVKDLGEPKNSTKYQGIDPLSDDYKKDGDLWITDNLYWLKINETDPIKKKYKNSVFLYKQMTGDIVDFAAVVKVWREEYSFYALNPEDNDYTRVTVSPGTSGSVDPDSDSDSVNLYATVLCIEISWPAQAPYDQREKRLFRQEIFNEAFRYY